MNLPDLEDVNTALCQKAGQPESVGFRGLAATWLLVPSDEPNLTIQVLFSRLSRINGKVHLFT